MSKATSAAMATASARRIDWRFLLPVPASYTFDKVVLVGADSELVDAFVATGLGRDVSTTLGDHDADLVAACVPSVASPTDLVKATRPGGLIYLEVDRRRGGTRRMSPRRLASEFAADGASVSAQYALRPAPDRCELYVPLDRSGALRWFLSSVYIASTPMKRLGETMLRWLSGPDASRVGGLAPFHATIAVVDPPDQPSAHARGSQSIAMLIHGGARVVQIAFSDRSSGAPQLVTKIPKVHSSAQRTRHEYAMVGRIREALGAPDSDSLPNPRELLDSPAGPVMVEDFAPGTSLARSCGRWGRSNRAKAEDLRLATSWLIRLHRHGAISDGQWSDERRIESVDRPLAAFASRFGTTDGEAELFDATRALAADLVGRPLPVVWEHGDFTIWNIFRDADRIRVLDWEHSRAGVPLPDVIRLATHWHEAVRGLETTTSRSEGFAELFTGTGKHSATNEARSAVQRYEQELDIDPRFRSMFLVMSRVELAIRRFEHQVESGLIVDDDVRAGNAALAYLSALVEHRGALFPLRP